MTTMTQQHQLADECDVGPARHEHDYKPRAGAAQRCTCGHTRWKIKIGGNLSPIVACAKCGNQNRVATAWVQGYYIGISHIRSKGQL